MRWCATSPPGNPFKACEKLETLLRLQNEPIAITAALIGSYVDMYRVKAGQQKKKAYARHTKDFGYKGSDFRLKRAVRPPRYTPAQLACLGNLAELDKSLKGSPVGEIFCCRPLCVQLAAGAPMSERLRIRQVLVVEENTTPRPWQGWWTG